MKHLEHFHELKSLTRKQKFFLLSLLPVYFMVIGLFLQPIQEIGPGIVRLIKEPDFLITDYFVVGGVGAALINAGALTLMSIGIIYFMGMDMDGHFLTLPYFLFSVIINQTSCEQNIPFCLRQSFQCKRDAPDIAVTSQCSGCNTFLSF